MGGELESYVTSSRGARSLPRSLRTAIIFNLLVTLALLPVAGQSFDLAGLTGTVGAWLRWGVPLFNHWKFGADLTAIAIGSQGLAFVLQHLGMGGAAALTTAWKLPLVAANIVTALALYDIAKRVDAGHPARAAVLWLVSPVPIFVAVGFGDVEPLTVLAFVLAIDLILRRWLIGSGIVIGLGIGIEYLPVLVIVVVVFAVIARVLTRREATYICIATFVTTTACFFPIFLSNIGRVSLFAGLHSSTGVTSAIHNTVVGVRSPSLWLLFGDGSPGRAWIFVGGIACLGVAGGLAFHVRSRGGSRSQLQFFVTATAAMLLIVVLVDPGVLPQFSDLVFGGLCLLSLVIEIPAWSLIAGPFLQLLTGIIWVYGGSFDSFWYDMWVTTGNAGLNLPESATVATWAGIAGIVIIVLGVVVAVKPSEHTRNIPKRTSVVAVSIACAGSLFFGVWSAQPAYWQGVGPSGPRLLADFASMTAAPSLPIRHARSTMIVDLPRSQVPLPKRPAREQKPYVSVTMALNSLVVPHGVGNPYPLPAEVAVSFRSLAAGARVTALWVEVLVGRKSWSSPDSVKMGMLPVLFDGTKELQASNDRWLTPGWVAVTYSFPVLGDSLPKHMVWRLQGEKGVVWNGSSNQRWLVVAVRSMIFPLVVDGRMLDTYVSAPVPLPYHPAEQSAVDTGLPLRRRLSVRIPTRFVDDVRLSGAVLHWPTSSPIDVRTGPTALVLIGFVYITMVGVGSFSVAWFISACGERKYLLRRGLRR